MNKEKQNFRTAMECTFFAVILLMIIFIGGSFLWIAITPYKLGQFFLVLSLCIKNAGSYSVLLVGIVITIFFQIYSKEKEIEKEDKIKIEEVGYYTLAFPRSDDKYEENFQKDKIVMEINDEEDYKFSAVNKRDKCIFFIKFLTSKEKSTNLKNIMAFGEDYFDKNKKDILKNYYHYCEKITYASPLYCSAKPTSELKSNKEADLNRYFWLITNTGSEAIIKNFWIAAVTEEGILLFVKVKAKIRKSDRGTQISLLQQTTYYKSNNKLCPLYR